MPIAFENIIDSGDASLYDVRSKAPGPQGSLPITPEMLLARPSGDLFGWAQNAGMGWDPRALGGKEILILSTHGGIRKPDGTPVALGYHTGHWEVGLLMEAAAEELKAQGAVPFAGFCTDPCDGRTQGTTGMFDSLPYRNDAASVFRRLIRSLPTRQRRDRRRDLRQRPARDDDGAGGDARPAVRAGARAASRCWPKRARTRGACNRWARVLRTTRSRSKTPPRICAARAPRRAAAASSWGPRQRRKWLARRWG